MRSIRADHPCPCGETLPATPGESQIAGHPRACGENLRAPRRGPNHDRAIPARAGKTQRTAHGWAESSGPSPRVRGKHPDAITAEPGRPGHPRACGENFPFDLHNTQSVRAIPARAGKTYMLTEARRSGRRAIPARAGKTGIPAASTPAASGHPRACGENVVPHLRVVPPRRAIPARAGKTATVPDGMPKRPGHPRACGENDGGQPESDSDDRAIPARAGKTINIRLFPRPDCRAIPARAGKTGQAGLLLDRQLRAIPARAGKTTIAGWAGAVGPGPSPRVRGKPSGRLQRRSRSAGHPRACGENCRHCWGKEHP